jgi:hypothetical protein
MLRKSKVCHPEEHLCDEGSEKQRFHCFFERFFAFHFVTAEDRALPARAMLRMTGLISQPLFHPVLSF